MKIGTSPPPRKVGKNWAGALNCFGLTDFRGDHVHTVTNYGWLCKLFLVFVFDEEGGKDDPRLVKLIEPRSANGSPVLPVPDSAINILLVHIDDLKDALRPMFLKRD